MEVFTHTLSESERAETRMLAFEYVVYLAARWYAENKGLTTSADLKAPNDLSASKLALYPFFFATANGHTIELMELMGPFYARPDGPLSEHLERRLFYTPTPGPDLFRFFLSDQPGANNQTECGLTVKPNLPTDWTALGETLKQTEFGSPRTLTLESVWVRPDANLDNAGRDVGGTGKAVTLAAALDRSREVIQGVDPRFVERSARYLTYLSQYFRSVRYFQQYDPQNRIDPLFIRNDRRAFSEPGPVVVASVPTPARVVMAN